MEILGIGDSSDSASVLLRDSSIFSCIEEERFSKKRHVDVFPKESIKYHLKKANSVNLAYGMNHPGFIIPRFDNYIIYPSLLPIRFPGCNSLSKLPQGFFINTANVAYWIAFKKLIYTRLVQRKRLSLRLKKRHDIVHHHLSHAAASYRVSGFRNSNILVLDGSGEDASTTLFAADRNGEIEKIKSFNQNNSLGILYTMITALLGFGRFGQGKTMGLSPYGTPNKKFMKMILTGKGSYAVQMNRVKNLINYKRFLNQPIKKIHKDIAASLQHSLEKTALILVKHLYETTGYKNLCLSGGVALNCSMNSFLLNSGYVKNIFIQPAANDAGTALGAALELAYHKGIKFKKLKHAYLGPSYGNESIRTALKKSKLRFHNYKDIEGKAAELLARNKIIAWFQGNMEFGPRALGNRSILAAPDSKEIRDKVNTIKQRESWRPLAPSILEEEASKYFLNIVDSPFMNLTFKVRPEKKQEIGGVVHVDSSARLQTVSKEINKPFYNLIKAFYQIKGLPLVLNTSFNSRGMPIVMTPEDAISEFLKMERLGLNYLVMGNYLISKK